MARYGIAVNIERCDGCYSCMLACKDEHVGNDRRPYAAAQPEMQKWLDVKEIEYGTGTKVKIDYIPIMCQHCKNPSCAKNAPEGAVYTREDGIVIIDPEKAKGCQDIAKNCPYGVVFWNEAEQLPQKCTMCAHLLDAGEKKPRCVSCCPSNALVFGDLDDPNSEISRFLAESDEIEDYKPEFGTLPTVQYRRLPKPFICGSIVLEDQPGECPGGVKVTLCGDDGCREVETDFFGDFEFRALKRNVSYTVKIAVEGYQPYEAKVRTNAAKNLGDIILKK